jgi:hypothetical protein
MSSLKSRAAGVQGGNEYQLWAVRYLNVPRLDFNVVRTDAGSRVSSSGPYPQSYHVHFELMRQRACASLGHRGCSPRVDIEGEWSLPYDHRPHRASCILASRASQGSDRASQCALI